jgi:hypothetical protein
MPQQASAVRLGEVIEEILLAAKLLLRSLSSTLYSKASATTRSLLSRLYVRSPVSA